MGTSKELRLRGQIYERVVSILARARNILFASFSFLFQALVLLSLYLLSSLSFHLVCFTFILTFILLSTVCTRYCFFMFSFTILTLTVFRLLAYVCCAYRTQYDGMALRSLRYLRILHRATGMYYLCVVVCDDRACISLG